MKDQMREAFEKHCIDNEGFRVGDFKREGDSYRNSFLDSAWRGVRFGSKWATEKQIEKDVEICEGLSQQFKLVGSPPSNNCYRNGAIGCKEAIRNQQR